MTKRNVWYFAVAAVIVLTILAVILGFFVPLPALATEVLGSAVGVFLALGFQEIIRLRSDQRRGVLLKRRLLEELRTIEDVLKTHASGYPFDCSMWASAKNAGEIGLLDEEDVSILSKAYMMIEQFNQDRRVLDSVTVEGNNEFRQHLLKHIQYEIEQLLLMLGALIPRLAEKQGPPSKQMIKTVRHFGSLSARRP